MMTCMSYDDEYECERYDDDGDHVEYDIQGSANLQTSLRTTSSTMMGPGGANHLEIHAHMCRSCVGKYCTSNLIRIGSQP